MTTIGGDWERPSAEVTNAGDFNAGSTFSDERPRLPRLRSYPVRIASTPQLYHQRSGQRKRLDWLNRAVVALDATNLTLTRSVAVTGEIDEETVIHELQPIDDELKLDLAARVDGRDNHPLGACVFS